MYNNSILAVNHLIYQETSKVREMLLLPHNHFYRIKKTIYPAPLNLIYEKTSLNYLFRQTLYDSYKLMKQANYEPIVILIKDLKVRCYKMIAFHSKIQQFIAEYDCQFTYPLLQALHLLYVPLQLLKENIEVLYSINPKSYIFFFILQNSFITHIYLNQVISHILFTFFIELYHANYIPFYTLKNFFVFQFNQLNIKIDKLIHILYTASPRQNQKNIFNLIREIIDELATIEITGTNFKAWIDLYNLLNAKIIFLYMKTHIQPHYLQNKKFYFTIYNIKADQFYEKLFAKFQYTPINEKLPIDHIDSLDIFSALGLTRLHIIKIHTIIHPFVTSTAYLNLYIDFLANNHNKSKLIGQILSDYQAQVLCHLLSYIHNKILVLKLQNSESIQLYLEQYKLGTQNNSEKFILLQNQLEILFEKYENLVNLI